MRIGVKLLFVVSALMFGYSRSAAWSIEGHKTIGELARSRLTAATRAKVANLLGNDDLAEVAVWADQVRDAGRHRGPLKDDPEAKAFVREFPKNDKWHYVDLPLGTKGYIDNGKFSRPDDVVHTINLCIGILEGNASKITRAQALKLLIHFVGDIHQPLHTSSGYFDLSDLNTPRLLVNPPTVNPANGDHGGNSLYVSKSQELHAYWDDKLVKKLDGKGYDELADNLVGKNPAGWRMTSDHHQWAEAWATESATIAEKAYRGITFGRATLNEKRELDRIEIKLSATYERANETVVSNQLAKAGLRLADLLNRIQWK